MSAALGKMLCRGLGFDDIFGKQPNALIDVDGVSGRFDVLILLDKRLGDLKSRTQRNAFLKGYCGGYC